MTSLQELAPKILERTREGKLEWAEGGSTGYITSVGETSLRLSTETVSFHTYYRLTLLNEMGTVIENYRPEFDPGNKLLAELYSLAHRQALKVDDKLESLKRSLEKL